MSENIIGTRIKIDGEKEFKSAITGINSDMRVLASEMKKVTAQFSSNKDSVESLTAKDKVLNEEVEKQKEKVNKLREALNYSAEKYGENDAKTKSWQTSLNKAEAELYKLDNELKDNKSALKDAEKATNDNGNAYDKLNKTISDQTDKLEDLKKKYTSVVLEQGKNSKEAKELYGEIGDLNDQLNNNKKRLNDAEDGLKKFKDGEDNAGSSAIKLGDLIKAHLISDAIIGGIKVLASVMKQAVSTLVDIGKQAVNSFAEYEQLIGGVETLFKDSAKTVENYANNAYKTAGLSANEYMETVTAFSASLLQSLNNDTKKSAEVADMAITDMADNANKMGTSMESVQNAYQGFAKQNYTMLDNLKLGYGGTKGEMERLLADAQKITGIKYDISNLNDVYQAIHVIQGELGITGTTAVEASETIQGSVAAMKSAWQNMLSGIANDNADFDGLVNNLVDSISVAAENLLPRIQVVINGVINLIMSLVNKLPEYLPQFLESGKNMLDTLLQGIQNTLPNVGPTVVAMISTLTTKVIEMLPELLKMGVNLLLEIVNGIGQTLPELVPVAINAVITLAETLLANIDTIIDAGINFIFALADGLIEALPTLIEKVPKIINDFWDAFDRNLWKIIQAGGELIIKLAKGLIDNIPVIIANAGQIIWAIVNTILHFDFINLGKNLIKNLGSGLSSMGGSIGSAAKEVFNKLLHPFSNTTTFKEIGINLLKGLASGLTAGVSGAITAAKNAAAGILNSVKGFFGIKSPSRVFRDEIGNNLALGLGEGFTGTMKNVAKDINESVPSSFDTVVNADVRSSFSSAAKNNMEPQFDYAAMVAVFKDSLKGMNVILDDEKIGKFVEDRIEGVVFS